MTKKCIGCGTTLQTDKQNATGYIPKEKYDDSSYCERCFKIMHYNEKIITKLENINDYIIEEVNKKAEYVYFLLDFLSISEETINTFKSIKVPKTLIISKLDIIPKSIKNNNIINWLQNEYKINEDIFFQSTKKNLNTSRITNYLEEHSIKEVYILGYTNTGKSTLINKLSTINNITNQTITTSLTPNTTVDFIKIKLNDNLTIIDSPGFTLNNTIYNENEFDLIKKVNPKTFLKPITYQVKEISSILIEDKIRISSSIKNSLTFYMSNDLSIERVFDNNKSLLEEPLTILDINDNSDLIIKGLGFINIKKSCTLKINIEDKNLLEVRKSMFE